MALVARAVGLATEAERARSALVSERETGRRRAVSDLHDGLGPVRAGMSTRVPAALCPAPPGQHRALLDEPGSDAQRDWDGVSRGEPARRWPPPGGTGGPPRPSAGGRGLAGQVADQDQRAGHQGAALG